MSKPKINLFEKIITVENFDNAYLKTLKGPLKYKISAIQFSSNLTENINILRESVKDGSYKPSGYYNFKVHEPKVREIYAPKYKDKIVQHAVNNILKDIYAKSYIKDSYACIEGKGTHACVSALGHYLRKAKWEFGDDAYIIKIDISKFFYSIDREILKKILTKKIKCKQTLHLLYSIIDSSPGVKGLPLGNLTSQLFANIYLNQLDQYCKRVLQISYYVRYADDIICVVKNKEEAQEHLKNIKLFLTTNLNLQAHPKKTKIFTISNCVNAIGYKNYTTHSLLRNDSKKKIKRKCAAFPYLFARKKVDKLKMEQMLNSWLGHAKTCSSRNFIQKLTSKHKFIYMIRKTKGSQTKKITLKVNINYLLKKRKRQP